MLSSFSLPFSRNKILPILLFFSFTIFSPSFGQNNLDSLFHLLDNQQADTSRCKTLYRIALTIGQKDLHQVVDYANQALQCAQANNQKLLIARTYSILGFYHRQLGNMPIALASHLKSIPIFEELGNERGLAMNWNNLALFYKADLQYDKALECFLKSAELRKKNKNLQRHLFKSYYNISTVFRSIGNYKESLTYLNLAFAEQEKLNLSVGIVACNIAGNIYKDLGQFDQAISYFERATSMTPNPKKSDELFNYALAYIELGNLLTVNNQFGKAKLALDEAKRLYNTHDFGIQGKKLFNLYSFQLATAKGDHQEALGYFKAYTTLRDSLFNQKSREISQNLEMTFDLERKEKEVQLLTTQSEIQQSNQQFLACIILLAILLGFGLMYIYWQSRRQNQLLQEDLKNKQLIEQQAEELQKTDALKSRLFANIAHELRTPLTLISGPVKRLLEGSSYTAANNEILNGILANSEHLIRMSDQIRELSKAEVSPIILELQQFSLNNFLHYLHSKFQLLATSKNIELKGFETLEDIVMITDGKKLETILSNLVSNALKYTDAGGQVQLIVKTLENQIQFELKDNGRGISNADLPHIFDRFFQAEHYEIIAEGGIGIGLSICKEYAQILDGQIKVESQLAKGSIFTLQIPQRLENKQTALVKPLEFIPLSVEVPLNTKPSSTLEPDYILIAEDNLELCKYLENILQSEYNLLFVHNGKAAIKQIENLRPALLITDLMMPIMDGMELVKTIRANSNWVDLPVLVLTARTGILEELKAIRVGVDDYLTKPFQEIELQTIIYNLLNLAEEQREGKAVAKEFLTNSKLPLANEMEEYMDKIDISWLKELEQTINDMALERNLTVDKIARSLSISSSHLTRKLKLLTGLTPKKYINEVKMLEARQMIETGDYTSVKAVAYSVGFGSEKVFSRNFKARYGKPPSEYLKQRS